MILLKSLNYKSTILTKNVYKTTPVNRQMHRSSEMINPFSEFIQESSLDNQTLLDQFYDYFKEEVLQQTPLSEILEKYHSNYEINVNPAALVDVMLYLAQKEEFDILRTIKDNMSLVVFKDKLMYVNELYYSSMAFQRDSLIGGYFKRAPENNQAVELFTTPGISKGIVIVPGWEKQEMPSGEGSAAPSGSGDGYNWKLIFVLTVASLWALVHIITYINDKFTEWENQKKLAEKPVEVTPQTEKDPENHRELSSVLEDFDNTVIMIISFLLVSCNLLSVIYLYRYYFISKLKKTKHDKHISN